jgi:predicted permease
MQAVRQDLLFGIRMLWKSPLFTAVAVMALALGIGANSAIFSVVNAVLLRQLPFKNPESLVWIWSTRVDRDKAFFSIPNFIDTRDQNRTLEEISAFANWGANLTERGDAERLQGVRLTTNALQMLGVKAIIGRSLLPEDDKPGSQRVVVLSHGLWQRRFGAARELIGEKLILNGDSYTVVGVLPPEFIFPGAEAEMAIPLTLETDPRRTERGSNFLRVFARLKPGMTREQAQSDLDGITDRLKQQYPDANAKLTAPRLIPLHNEIVGNYHGALLMLLGAVGLVLLIACSNLANLLLARASARQKEIAVRAALGATRMRLIGQFLTESLILAILGGALGIILAMWGVRLLLALGPADLPRAGEVDIDARVLLFTFIISILAGIIFGLSPALQASRVDLNEELKAGGRTSSDGAGRSHPRNLLVITEVALSLLLLISAGLFVKSFLRLQAVSPGFNPENLLTVRLSLPRSKYSNRETVKIFYEKISPRLGSLPGVESVGLISVLPLSGMNTRADYTIVGRPPLSPTEAPGAQNRWVSAGYFKTMGIPILKGREFTEHDTSSAQSVVIIDEALARRYWPNESPLGAHLKIDDGGTVPREVEIVGVAGGVKQFGLDDEPTATIYAPFYQIPENTVSFLINSMNLVVKTTTNPLALSNAVRQEVQAVDKDVPASGMKSMEQALSVVIAPRRFNLMMLGIFAVTALLLAATGLYAMISFSVNQRSTEIGIRLALGAQQFDILKLIVGQGLKLVLVGVVIGIAGSLALTRLLSSLLFNVSPTDPYTFLAMSLLLTLVALLAGYIPARKATKIDPIIALR